LDRELTRQLDKQEAIRHLIHGAVRLFMAAEDQFVIHMLVQSADKLLIDISKKSGRTLKLDWVEFIKPEKLDFFFRIYRKTYNFFKHADHDFGQDLPIHDIAGFNIIALFVAIQNYHALFGSYTGHMALHNMFVQAVMPGIFRVEMNPQQAVAYDDLLKKLATMTPREFFSIVTEYMNLYAPTFDAERFEDTKDAQEFYASTFEVLHRKDSAVK
jgi:hypothetical protein